MKTSIRWMRALAVATGAALVVASGSARAEVTLLNVSYDPTREFYENFNELFSQHWQATKGEAVTVNQSHGGSGKQARAVIDGLEADVVTLGLAGDVQALQERGNLLPKAWQQRLPNNSCPYTSTVVFLVRKGNPKQIKDWEDLAKEGVEVVAANPKTSGAGRWNYLGAWAYAQSKWPGDEAKAKELVGGIYRNVVVFDTAARGSTTTFVERRIGDVMLNWENEVFLAKEQAPDDFEIVVPSVSVHAEPPVAVVDTVARRKGTTEVAEAYLQYLYSPEAQELAGRYYYRPSDPAALAKYESRFPALQLVPISQIAGDWKTATAKHFADGGIFDQAMAEK